MKVIFLRGAPGSGKSTYAKSLISNSDNIKRVSRDEIREELDFYKYSNLTESEKLVSKIEKHNILDVLKNGHDLIIDVTLTEVRYLNNYFDLFFNTGLDLDFEYVDFSAVSLVTCLNNNVSRRNLGGRFVPEAVIRKMHAKCVNGLRNFENAFKKLTKDFEDNSWLQNKYLKIEEGTPVVICDIDGTIAHMNGRSPYEFHKVGQDTLDDTLKEVLISLPYPIVFLSGRDSICREATIKWLEKHGFSDPILHMRKEKDMRKDWIVKLELLEKEIIGQGQRPVLCFDDRDSVCQLWRYLGLKCYQVNYGDF